MEEFLYRARPTRVHPGSAQWIAVQNEMEGGGNGASPSLLDAAWFKDLAARLKELAERKASKAEWDALRAKILESAREHKAGSGKWLLNFESERHVDEVWTHIATETFKGNLGAKVSPCAGLKGPVQHSSLCVCEGILGRGQMPADNRRIAPDGNPHQKGFVSWFQAGYLHTLEN